MIHNNIKVLRIKNNFTQEEMAEASNCSQNTWSLIETGKTPLVHIDRIIKIAKILNCHPLELFEGTELSIKAYNEYQNSSLKSL
ncbi:helix-turn-helix domain-containing protein [Ferruginibacter sp. SUN002]|uniref:helix-turn-helix domain-containing protein n=1 Tax=Ferruginibacter sp. SUN002 TaxID=2937789 RepID=UPI003D3666BF